MKRKSDKKKISSYGRSEDVTETEDQDCTDIVPVDAERTQTIVGVQEADVIRKRLLEIKDDVGVLYFEMGRLLRDVLEKVTPNGKPLWASYGFDSFQRYCEEELGYKQRKAYYILSVFKTATEGVLVGKDLSEVGPAKATILAALAKKGVITEQVVDKWIERAKTSTFDELQTMQKKAVAESRRKADEGGKRQTAPEEVQIFRVPMFKDQWDNLQVALNKAKAITGSDKTPWLLDCICMAFNSEAFETKTDGLDEVCRRVERVFGVRILAIHAENHDVVFGDRLAKMLKAAEEPEKKKKREEAD